MTRRGVLALSAAVPAALLGGCSVTGSGGAVVVTIDVATIMRDGSALVVALQATLAAPAVAGLLGPEAAVAEAALAGAQAALTAIEALTGGSVAVDTARVQALVQTLIADAQTVLGVAQPGVGGADSEVPGGGSYLAAAAALLPFLALAASLPMPAGARGAVRTMSEREALTIVDGAGPADGQGVR